MSKNITIEDLAEPEKERVLAQIEREIQLGETKISRKTDILNEAITQSIGHLSKPEDIRSMTNLTDSQVILLTLMKNAGKCAGYNPYLEMVADIEHYLISVKRGGRDDQKDIAIARLEQKREEEISGLRQQIGKYI